MFIYTEATPNPASLKFLPGQTVLKSDTADFKAGDDVTRSPLAMRLLELNAVTGVFFATDFITVTKRDDADWAAIKPLVLGVIMDHFVAGLPVMKDDGAATAPAHKGSDLDSEIVKQIIELLDTRIRPAVANDGGDIVFDRFEDGIVFLRMQGACAGCPSSTATLKTGIENMLRHYVPEVLEVQQVREGE